MPTASFRVLAAIAALGAASLLAGCGSSGSSSAASSGDTSSSAAAAAGSTSSSTGFNVDSVTEDTSLHALLPAADRTSITVGTTLTPVEAPYTATVDGTTSGLQPQLYDAIGRVLGVKIEATNATFEEVIPGVEDGKFAIGVDNFGVTAAREKVVTFVSYFNDGQSFIVPTSSTLKPVTGASTITNLCGLTVGTEAGTTFQQILDDQKGACTKAGKKPFTVDVYSDPATPILALKEGRIDVYMGPTAGDKYLAAHDGFKFLSQYSSTPVGFVVDKGSSIEKPLQDALNELIKTGAYAKILKAWDVGSLGVTSSQINPTSSLG